MVLPLVDEDNPKCYICHKGFKDIKELREHQTTHKEFKPSEKKLEPAPGDITVF